MSGSERDFSGHGMGNLTQAPDLPSRDGEMLEAGSSRREHRRHRRRSHGDSRREIDRLRFQRRLLSLACALLLVAVLVLGSTTLHYRASHEATARAALVSKQNNADRIRELEEGLRTADASLLEARDGLKALVAGRIPGLAALEFGTTLPVGDALVREITFQQLPGGLEYKVVLENNSRTPIRPNASVLLFDQFGVEVARSDLGRSLDPEGEMLRPGEIRSHFSLFELPASQATYFRVLED